ncbi:hypothetical protein C8R45DRAFT_947612 [Mycena sanguinolenta]|nr:hypothetical protein C8R45DRAFT_947612 [Mycena sanguinolenta]
MKTDHQSSDIPEHGDERLHNAAALPGDNLAVVAVPASAHHIRARSRCAYRKETTSAPSAEREQEYIVTAERLWISGRVCGSETQRLEYGREVRAEDPGQTCSSWFGGSGIGRSEPGSILPRSDVLWDDWLVSTSESASEVIARDADKQDRPAGPSALAGRSDPEPSSTRRHRAGIANERVSTRAQRELRKRTERARLGFRDVDERWAVLSARALERTWLSAGTAQGDSKRVRQRDREQERIVMAARSWISELTGAKRKTLVDYKGARRVESSRRKNEAWAEDSRETCCDLFGTGCSAEPGSGSHLPRCQCSCSKWLRGSARNAEQNQGIEENEVGLEQNAKQNGNITYHHDPMHPRGVEPADLYTSSSVHLKLPCNSAAMPVKIAASERTACHFNEYESKLKTSKQAQIQNTNQNLDEQKRIKRVLLWSERALGESKPASPSTLHGCSKFRHVRGEVPTTKDTFCIRSLPPGQQMHWHACTRRKAIPNTPDLNLSLPSQIIDRGRLEPGEIQLPASREYVPRPSYQGLDAKA